MGCCGLSMLMPAHIMKTGVQRSHLFVCHCLWLTTHKLPTTANSRSLCEWTFVKRLCVFYRKLLKTRSDASERSAFSELLPSKDWLLEANFGIKLELQIGMYSWSNVSERRSQWPCVRSQTQTFGFPCPASPLPEKRNYFGECLPFNPFWEQIKLQTKYTTITEKAIC